MDVVCSANFDPGKVHLFENNANFLETDGDGVRDDPDCAPNNATAFARPREIQGVTFPTQASIARTPAARLAGSGTAYDVLRGSLAQFPVGTGPGETCLAQTTPAASLSVGPAPPVGAGFYYLVRGRNACGAGSYGFETSGRERASPACP